MAVSAILDFGQCSIFYLDDIEGRVISLFKGFPGWGVHFCSYLLDTELSQGQIISRKLKFDLTFGKDHLY